MLKFKPREGGQLILREGGRGDPGGVAGHPLTSPGAGDTRDLSLTDYRFRSHFYPDADFSGSQIQHKFLT